MVLDRSARQAHSIKQPFVTILAESSLAKKLREVEMRHGVLTNKFDIVKGLEI